MSMLGTWDNYLWGGRTLAPPPSAVIDVPPTEDITPPGTVTAGDVTADALCSLGPLAYVMTGVLVGMVRQHFASRDNIEDPVLRDLVWDASEGSAIVIESITRWKPSASGQRSAVVIKRGAVTVESLGIDDEFQGQFLPDGRQLYGTSLRGSHTLFCLATEAGAAERLSTEVYRDLIECGSALRRDLNLLKFKVAHVDELHKVEEAMGSYAVPVTVAYAFEETWTLDAHAPRLKRITINTIIDNMG